jgi:nucleoside phosphorylase
MQVRSVAILTAVQLEAKGVAAALRMGRPKPNQPMKGIVEGLEISLHLIAIGAVGLAEINFDSKPEWVIMAGLAGALDPSLKVGDVVIGEGPITLDSSGLRHGTIHTSKHLISTAQEKAELFASTKAAAVDMETAIVQQWAQRQGIQFVSIRAISDSAAQEVNPEVLALVDLWGKPRAGAVGALLLRKRSAARDLFRLARDSKLASERLGSAVRDLVQHLAHLTPDNVIAKPE